MNSPRRWRRACPCGSTSSARPSAPGSRHGVLSSPVKIKPAALPPELILDEAIARIILGNIDHFVANWASLREGDDPEAIHQMRVALRRLRAALAMFKRVIPCAEFELFRAEARDLASAMGPARDCDALRELVEEGPLAHLGDKRNFAPLMEALEARRLEATRTSAPCSNRRSPPASSCGSALSSSGAAGAIRFPARNWAASPNRWRSSPAKRWSGFTSACCGAAKIWRSCPTRRGIRRASP